MLLLFCCYSFITKEESLLSLATTVWYVSVLCTNGVFFGVFLGSFVPNLCICHKYGQWFLIGF